MTGFEVRTEIQPLCAGLRSASLRYAGRAFMEETSWWSGAVFCRLRAMSIDSELQKHYALLLGVGSPWKVKTVDLKIAEKKVE